MTSWAQISTGLLCYACVGIHQVRILVFNILQNVSSAFKEKVYIIIKSYKYKHFIHHLYEFGIYLK